MFPEDLIITLQKKEEIFEMKSEFPYVLRHFRLPAGHTLIASWHWHEELEFAFVKNGILEYRTMQSTVQLKAGDAVFVSGNVLHQVTALSCDTETEYEVHMFRKDFFSVSGSLLEKQYIRPLLRNYASSCFCLRNNCPAHQSALHHIQELSSCSRFQPFGHELLIRNYISLMILDLHRLFRSSDPSFSDALHCTPHSGESHLKQMLLFIQEHYMENLTLQDIAASVPISTRECLRCFQNGLSTTPFSYLQEYRIQSACHLLCSTSLSITSVAEKCGFNSCSYFGKVFQKTTGYSPKKYRRLHASSRLSQPEH